MNSYADFTTDLRVIYIHKGIGADTRCLTDALGGQANKVRHPWHIREGSVRECVAQDGCADGDRDDDETKKQVNFRPGIRERRKFKQRTLSAGAAKGRWSVDCLCLCVSLRVSLSLCLCVTVSLYRCV